MSRKILVSYGYGAGWSSWADGNKLGKFVAEYKPIIDFIEAGGNPAELENPQHPVTQKLMKDICEHLDTDEPYFYIGGADGLRVVEIPDGVKYRIDEYDGAESYLLLMDDDGWW